MLTLRAFLLRLRAEPIFIRALSRQLFAAASLLAATNAVRPSHHEQGDLFAFPLFLASPVQSAAGVTASRVRDLARCGRRTGRGEETAIGVTGASLALAGGASRGGGLLGVHWDRRILS